MIRSDINFNSSIFIQLLVISIATVIASVKFTKERHNEHVNELKVQLDISICGEIDKTAAHQVKIMRSDEMNNVKQE